MSINKLYNDYVMNVGKNKGPTVVIKKREIRGYIRDLFAVKDINLEKRISKILSGLGFAENDVIDFMDIINNGSEAIIKYSLNGEFKDEYRIILRYDNAIFKNRFVVCDDTKEIECNIAIFTTNNIELRIKKFTKKLGNGREISRIFNNVNTFVGYVIKCDDTEIEIKLGFSKDNQYDKDTYLIFGEDGIIYNFLKNIDLSVGIEEIYSMLTRYIDMNAYKFMSITKYRYEDCNKVVTDLLDIVDGNLEYAMITDGNRVVSLDSKYSCEYVCDNKKYSFSIISLGNDVEVSVALNNVEFAKEYFESEISKDIARASEYVDGVKKRVRALTHSK